MRLPNEVPAKAYGGSQAADAARTTSASSLTVPILSLRGEAPKPGISKTMTS
jgi:hypothetical protein